MKTEVCKNDYVTGSDTSNAHASKMVPFLVTIVFSCRRAKTIQVECLIQNINLFLKYSDSACGWKVHDKSHAKTSRKGQRRDGETSDWTECVSWSSGIQVSLSQYFPPCVILKLSGKIFAYPTADLRGKNCLQITTLFRIPGVLFKTFYLFFRSFIIIKQANQGEKKYLVKCFIMWGQTSWHCF